MNSIKNVILGGVVTASLLPVLCAAQSSQAETSAQIAPCRVESSWIYKPSMPLEVKKSGADGSSTFCDFYQFSTQTFLYLMSPAGADLRNFQTQANYPVLEFNPDGSNANSCDDLVKGPTLRMNLIKSGNSSMSTGQAGGGATIYAQDGNVVYYDVRFSRALCSLSGSAVTLHKQNTINFPSGTTEIKSAWKKLSEQEVKSNRFVTQRQELNGTFVTLGLVGIHIAVATTDHPEFVWMSYEHKNNAPDCEPTKDQSASGWLFASESCTSKLPGSASSTDSCKFNQPPKNATTATGTPTNICRIYPYGTAQGDLKADENLSSILRQNSELDLLLISDAVSAPMKVLRNYFLLGALWVSDIEKNSGGVGLPNERGSLRLANSVAETAHQDVNIQSTFASNCFGCHNYSGTKQKVSNNITSQNLSHLFLNVKIGQGEAIDVSAPTIINNAAAPAICGGDGTKKNLGACKNAANNLKWNGQWTNANATSGAVCGCIAE